MSSADTCVSSVLMRCISASAASPSSPESCLRRSSSPSSVFLVGIGLRSSPISSASSRSCTRRRTGAGPRPGFELVEVAPGAVLDQRAPEIDQLLGRRRRRQAGEALAHQKRQRVLDRRVGALGDVVEFAAVESLLEHRGEFWATPSMRRAPIASTRACSTASNTARACWPAGCRRRCTAGSWQASLQRDGIGMAAHDRSFTTGELTRRLRQADLAAHQAGRSAAKATSSSGLRAMARRQPVTARLNGSVGEFLDEGFDLLLEAMFLSPRRTEGYDSATFTELSGSSTPKQR